MAGSSYYVAVMCLVLLEVLCVQSQNSKCYDQNVRYNGDTLTVTNAKTADDCSNNCKTRSKDCGGWTFSNGKCELKKSSRPGDKVPSVGAVSGDPGACGAASGVTSIKCRYTDNNQEVSCIFPFVGDNPGQRSGGSVNDACRKTKKGRFWCATKVNTDNRVVGTSVQNRDVTCGQEKNKSNKLYCAPSASSSSATTSRPRTSSPTTKATTTRGTTRKTTKTTFKDDGVTNQELVEFTENLIKIDDDDVASLVKIDTGCSTRVGRPNDCSPNKLISSVDNSVLSRPVYKALRALYGNYNNDIGVKEDRTRAERKEEDEFLDEVMKSKVMKETVQFLKNNKIFTKSEKDFRNLLKELWFDVYSRGRRILGSSGFEHVFLGEKKNGTVQGFHNWVYFHHLEQTSDVNYLGHWEEVDLGGRGTGLAFTFKWGAEQKPYASMVVGTSPQLEMAVYTICILTRPEKKCEVSLAGQRVAVTTHVFTRPGGVKYVASAYFDWK